MTITRALMKTINKIQLKFRFGIPIRTYFRLRLVIFNNARATAKGNATTTYV